MSGKRISTQQIEEIVALYEEGLTQRQIAAKTGVSIKTVNDKILTFRKRKRPRIFVNANAISAAEFARKTIKEEAKIIVRHAVDAAKKGEQWAVKLLFERIVPVSKIAPVSLELKQGKNISEVKQNIDTILEKLSVGAITGDEIKPFLDVFEMQKNVLEKEQIAKELEQLEAFMPGKN